MRSFVTRLSVFICIFIVLDVCFGLIMDFMRTHARSGDTARTEYICNHTNEDLLIMGSSRAAHHYVPSVLQDSLGVSVYNCGYDGCGIILAYTQLQMLLKHYKPKCIVYELTPSFDFVEGDNLRYIKPMRPYFHSGVLNEVLQDIDKSELVKNYSSLYRYNSSYLTIISDWLKQPDSPDNGYKPIFRVAEEIPKKNLDYTEARNLDYYKIEIMNRFMETCEQNNILLIMAVSPLFTNDSTVSVFQPIFEILLQKGIPVLDFSCHASFNWKREYFSDSCHLNHSGAIEYSKAISMEINKIMFTFHE